MLISLINYIIYLIQLTTIMFFTTAFLTVFLEAVTMMFLAAHNVPPSSFLLHDMQSETSWKDKYS
ncbi:hypothetical protein C0971_08475 [Bacillus methanolicus]|nr:hypothetical protein C0971_08475 [Bacillus methanolicus]